MTVVDHKHSLAKGDLIQWYRVEDVLGQGGFGITYLATDTNLDHKVAIKEYMPAPLVKRQSDNTLISQSGQSKAQYRQGLQRFLREARTLVKFRHPNIVRVMAVFEANNTAYLVMEYEEGEQFKEYVKRGDGLAEPQLKKLILSIIDGLDQVHQHGFIHRDIKPVNLIIRKDGSPVLLDFGSTRPVKNEGQVRHTSVVSVGYTPLEQYQEGAGLKVGPWTDIYSLGATLYYAISGVTPVSPVSRLAALVKKSKDPLRPAILIGGEQYSSAFLQAIDWALGFRIEDRPQTLAQWRKSFDAPVVVPAALPTVSVGLSTAAPLGGQGDALNHSKLLLRKPVAQRKARSKPGNNGQGLAGAFTIVGICLFIAVVATWWYHSQQQQRLLEQTFERADLAFAQGDYFAGARPLYLQILTSNPRDQQALKKLAEINDIAVGQVNQALKAGRLDDAQEALAQLESIDDPRMPVLKKRLAGQRLLQAEEKQLREVKTLIAQKAFGQARDKLAQMRLEFADKTRIDSLEATVQTEIDEQQARLAEAEKNRLSREKSLQQLQRRVADAKERQRQRSRDYRRYLDNAEQALQAGEITTAGNWLDNAASLQINDDQLADLATRIAYAEKLSAKPLSEYEIRYAQAQFNALKRAIESKNLQAITELTNAGSSRRGLFATLFDRYTQISVQIRQVEPRDSPKRVTALLEIERMALPNGDVVYPSSTYRDTELSLERKRYSWSAINW